MRGAVRGLARSRPLLLAPGAGGGRPRDRDARPPPRRWSSPCSPRPCGCTARGCAACGGRWLAAALLGRRLRRGLVPAQPARARLAAVAVRRGAVGHAPPAARWSRPTTASPRTPRETIEVVGDLYLSRFLGGIVLLAAALAAPLLAWRRRAVWIASAAAVVSLLIWARAPFTGVPPLEVRIPEGVFSTTRYLVPAVAAAIVALALAGSGARLARAGGAAAAGGRAWHRARAGASASASRPCRRRSRRWPGRVGAAPWPVVAVPSRGAPDPGVPSREPVAGGARRWSSGALLAVPASGYLERHAQRGGVRLGRRPAGWREQPDDSTAGGERAARGRAPRRRPPAAPARADPPGQTCRRSAPARGGATWCSTSARPADADVTGCARLHPRPPAYRDAAFQRLGPSAGDPPPRHPLRLALAGIALAALAVRLVYGLRVMGDTASAATRSSSTCWPRRSGDTGSYLQPFPWLLDHQEIPTAEKPPLFPGYLARVDRARRRQLQRAPRGDRAASAPARSRRSARWGAVSAARRSGSWPRRSRRSTRTSILLDASLRSESLYVLLIALALLARLPRGGTAELAARRPARRRHRPGGAHPLGGRLREQRQVDQQHVQRLAAQRGVERVLGWGGQAPPPPPGAPPTTTTAPPPPPAPPRPRPPSRRVPAPRRPAAADGRRPLPAPRKAVAARCAL